MPTGRQDVWLEIAYITKSAEVELGESYELVCHDEPQLLVFSHNSEHFIVLHNGDNRSCVGNGPFPPHMCVVYEGAKYYMSRRAHPEDLCEDGKFIKPLFDFVSTLEPQYLIDAWARSCARGRAVLEYIEPCLRWWVKEGAPANPYSEGECGTSGAVEVIRDSVLMGLKVGSDYKPTSNLCSAREYIVRKALGPEALGEA